MLMSQNDATLKSVAARPRPRRESPTAWAPAEPHAQDQAYQAPCTKPHERGGGCLTNRRNLTAQDQGISKPGLAETFRAGSGASQTESRNPWRRGRAYGSQIAETSHAEVRGCEDQIAKPLAQDRASEEQEPQTSHTGIGRVGTESQTLAAQDRACRSRVGVYLRPPSRSQATSCPPLQMTLGDRRDRVRRGECRARVLARGRVGARARAPGRRSARARRARGRDRRGRPRGPGLARRAVNGVAHGLSRRGRLSPVGGTAPGALPGQRGGHARSAAASPPTPASAHRVHLDGRRAGDPLGRHAGDGDTPVTLAQMVGPYKRVEVPRRAGGARARAKGVPVVIVNPSAPVGPWDVKPTPTGQMIVDFLRGRMFASLDTGLNVVHVRDVARGHLLAAERGRVGEKYILGHADLRSWRSVGCWPRSAAPRAARSDPVRGGLAGRRLHGGRGACDGHAGRAADGGAHGAQAHVLQSSQGGARAGIASDRRPGKRWRDAVAWFVEHGYVQLERGASVIAASGLSSHAAEPLQLLLRVPRAARPRREALYAVYAFCRTVDDIVDLGEERGLDRAGRAISSSTGGGRWRGVTRPAARPASRSPSGWPWPCGSTRIPREALEAIIDGVAMDLEGGGYETVEDCIRIVIGWPRPWGSAASRSSATRTSAPATTRSTWASALQLTNILRDVGSDARPDGCICRGRICGPST